MLDVRGISHRYTRDRWIFQDVTVRVAPGEVLAVLGPNARGKTTMIKCFAGLIAPTEGTAIVDGSVGYVPQTHAPMFSYSVFDMVLMGCARRVRAYSSPGAADRAVAAESLERVGMTHLATRDFGHLSGGERQMVLIARALASRCTLMVLDEPASALDLRNQARVLAVLRSLADDGMSIVMTTHHPDHALHIAEHSLLLVAADDVRVGDTRELLVGPSLSALYEVDIVTADVETPSATRRIIVPDFGPGIDTVSPASRFTDHTNHEVRT